MSEPTVTYQAQSVRPHANDSNDTGVAQAEYAEAMARLIAALREIPGMVAHDGRVAGRNMNYTYTSHAGVLAHVRDVLLRHGIVVIPASQTLVDQSIVELASGGKAVLVTVQTVWHVWVGHVLLFQVPIFSQGMDNTDKAFPKALTVASRLLLKVLCHLAFTDDPERYDTGDNVTDVAKPVAEVSSPQLHQKPATMPAEPVRPQPAPANVQETLQAIAATGDFQSLISLFNNLPPDVRRVVQEPFAQRLAELRSKGGA